jgi:hypothetical protein
MSQVGEPSQRKREKKPREEVDTSEDTVMTDVQDVHVVKVQQPDTFDGNRHKLRSFIAQCGLYIAFNKNKFKHETQQVLWAVTFFRGAAFDWVDPILTNYQKFVDAGGKCNTAMAKKTQDTFHTWDWFVRELNKAFGDLDQRNTAARELNNLRQRGSVTKYMAEFQRHAMRLGYDDEALKDKFYNGLKDFVKDEISRSDKPTTLEGLIELAVRIDNRQYERSLERRGGYDPRSRQNKKSGRHGRQGDPMELDATRKDITKQERDRRRKENLCYECGMPGHRASSHGKGKSPRQGKNSRRNGQASATRREEYQQISATNRTPLMPTEEELEEQMIHTQLQERDWEYDSQGDPIGSEGPDEENCGCNGCGAINCSGCSGPVGLDEERVAGRAVLDMIFGRIGMRYTSPEPLEQDDTDSEESSVASNSGNEGSVTLAEIAFGEAASTTETKETRQTRQEREP